MPDANSIWKQTLAGVLSGVALLAIGWVLGWLPVIWAWVVAAVISILAVLGTPLTLPLWLILLAGIIFCVVALRALRSARVNGSRENAVESSASVADAPFNELETAVLQLFATVDGTWINIEFIGQRLQTSQLLVEQVIQRLFRRGLLLDTHNYLNGTSFRLNERGRDLVIQLGYVRPSPYRVQP